MVAKEPARSDTARSTANSPNLMKTKDEYIGGAHDYWAHFWCGLIIGGIVGLGMGWQFFDAGWAIVATAVVASLVLAYSCGCWGDLAWYRFIQIIGSWIGGGGW